jgi:hypothetical protein
MRATWVLLLCLAACAPRTPPRRDAVAAAAVPVDPRAACDRVAHAIETVQGAFVTRGEEVFEDPIHRRTLLGCSVLLAGSFRELGDEPPVDVVLHDTLADEGWIEDYDYSLDGPDGSSFGFRRDGVLCLVEGRWDGGVLEDDDPPLSDRYEVTTRCGAGVVPN